MKLGIAMAAALCIVVNVAHAQGTATTTVKPGANNAVLKATQCAEVKKRIAAYQAAPKGQKNPGDETIKKDIAWYQANCN